MLNFSTDRQHILINTLIHTYKGVCVPIVHVQMSAFQSDQRQFMRLNDIFIRRSTVEENFK